MTALLGLLGSKVGGYLLAGFGMLVAASIALLKAYSAGKRSEQDKQKTAQLDAVKERRAVDEDVARLDDSSVRERLRNRWQR